MAPATQAGAGWVHVRPLRQATHAQGRTTDPSPATLTGASSPPPMIRRRSPASSSFVLAAARLRALQLDPGPRDGGKTAAARKPQANSQPKPGDRAQGTGPDPHALLTTGAPMGAVLDCDAPAVQAALIYRSKERDLFPGRAGRLQRGDPAQRRAHLLDDRLRK